MPLPYRIALLACLLLPAAFAQAVDLTLYYNERPPFTSSSTNGEVHGLTADPAVAAVRAAGLSYQWQERPVNRILALVKANQEPACAVALFKTPDRAAFAQFSLPLYRDHPTVVVTSHDDLGSLGTLASLLSSRRYRLIVKERFSYGPVIDDMMEREHPVKTSSPYEVIDLLTAVRKDLADYTILPREEAEYWLSRDKQAQGTLRIVSFPDLPRGEQRFLMCSNMVSPAIMNKLNAAIRQSVHVE